jgi:hypothetical protein
VAISPAETGLFAAMNCMPKRPLLSMVPATHGRASLPVPAGLELSLWAGDSLFVQQQDGQGVARDSGSRSGQPIVVGAGKELRLRLVLSIDLTIRVAVVDPDGQPVVDAPLTFDRIRNGHIERIRMATTDASGQFELPLSGAWNNPFLLITAQGSGPSLGLRAVRRLQLESAPTVAELRLAPAHDLVGHVRDASGRAIEAEVRRLIRFQGESEWIGTGWYKNTDGNGAFCMPSIPDAVHRLVIRSDGFATAIRDDVKPGAPIEVVLESATRVRLRTSAVATAIRDIRVHVGYLAAKDGIAPAWPALGPTTNWSHSALHALSTVDGTRQIEGPDGVWRF